MVYNDARARRNGKYLGMALRGAYHLYKNKGKVGAAAAAVYGASKKIYSSHANRNKSKSKSIHQKSVHEGTGGSMSKFNYGRRKMSKFNYRLFRKTAAPNFQLYNNASRLSASVGVQGASSLVSMFTVAEMTDISTSISSTTPGKTKRIAFQSISCNCMITNQDKGNAIIEIYDIISRRDLNNSETQNPWTAWGNSYSDEGGSDSDLQIIGATPFSAVLFTQYFKVLKVTHIVLAQGQTHQHRVHFAPNKILNAEILDHTSYGVKGLTAFSMIVYRGAPYNDATTKSQVSTGSVALDVVNTKQYRYSWADDRDTNWTLTNNLPGSFTVNENVMDVGSGEAEVDAQA